MKRINALCLVLACATAVLSSCSIDFGADISESSTSEGNGNGSNAGIITAGEWNDLENWEFWTGLISGQSQENYYRHLEHWSLFTEGRIPVTVTDVEDNPVCGAKVELFVDGTLVWTSVSDNIGSAELWYSYNSNPENDTDEMVTFTVKVNGSAIALPVQPGKENIVKCVDILPCSKSVDIAFIVDATGSMGDEINFLKDDLMDILKKVSISQSDKSFRTAALFYRDEGDQNLTRHDNFSDDPATTLNFIKKQEAKGGGDYPEAVHTALENAMQNLAWDEGNYARLAFLILDAPPHHTQKILDSIHSSIKEYAAKGIKIIPVAASGVDKSTEFLVRLMAMMTDGTYVFITNDSGVGNDHISPTVGGYQVEQLNSLLIRLINKYSE